MTKAASPQLMGGAARHAMSGKPLYETEHVNRKEYLRRARANGDWSGLAVAMLVLGAWASALAQGFLRTDLGTSSLGQALGLAGLITWLYAGLFITAHDAMHGLVCPRNRRLNHLIGWLCVKSYALFDYRTLLHAHWAHHRHSGHPGEDPDFHDGVHKHPVLWYAHFMREYCQPSQLAGMGVLFNALHFSFGIPLANLFLFWVGPSLLSSAQLFYFGTYLPHRDDQRFPDTHRAATDYSKSPVYHFLTCFNFGLHHEHHLYPWCPWWRLQILRGVAAPSRSEDASKVDASMGAKKEGPVAAG